LSRIENPDPNAVDMNAGVQAMRIEKDPERAAQLFRQVLARSPNHFGAHLQLAKALDLLGQTDAALALWEKVLTMAESYGDEERASVARARLADRRPPLEVVKGTDR
jgi:cytochrome c-type biogenesis protein CcmH/NrfG